MVHHRCMASAFGVVLFGPDPRTCKSMLRGMMVKQARIFMMVAVAVHTSRRRAATGLPGAVHTEAVFMA
ncbi:MAG TPA: hypothetical protein DD444_06620 [Citreicella sp.]|nr:hypothetical protein [Citreicella sp.]|tara:strand:- start:795 stop:1001 length:207 start_codon:yes stop_codon:yes gene_type:complete